MADYFDMPPNLAYADVPLNHGPGNVHLRVERNGRDWGRGTIYYYSITGPGLDHRKYEDLRTGVNVDDGPLAMLGTLLSFLTACAESYPDGENADMFPPAVAEWAQQHSDELTMLWLEIDGDEES